MLTEKLLIPKEGEITSLELKLAEAKIHGATMYRVNQFGIQMLAKNSKLEELEHRLKIANENVVSIIREIAEERAEEINVSTEILPDLIEKTKNALGEKILKEIEDFNSKVLDRAVAKFEDKSTMHHPEEVEDECTTHQPKIEVKGVMFHPATPPCKGEVLIFETPSDMYPNFTVGKEYKVDEHSGYYIYVKNDLLYLKSFGRIQPELPSFWRKHFRLKESEQKAEPLMEGTQLVSIAPFYMKDGEKVFLYMHDDYCMTVLLEAGQPP